MIRLVATDMDGTLLNSQKEAPPEFPRWAAAHPEIRVAIASGRQYATLLDAFPAIADRLIYIAENGALVFERGEILYRNVMEREDARASIERVEGLAGVTPILCGVRSAHMPPAPPFVEEQARIYYHRLAVTERWREAVETDEIVKIALYIENYRAAETAPLLEGLGVRLKSVVSGPDWIDIGNRSVNKGAALRAIQARYGIGQAESMGFGDYMNDYELLEACGESYAVANACPEILTLAKHRTASNDENGVMRVLETL